VLLVYVVAGILFCWVVLVCVIVLVCFQFMFDFSLIIWMAWLLVDLFEFAGLGLVDWYVCLFWYVCFVYKFVVGDCLIIRCGCLFCLFDCGLCWLCLCRVYNSVV